MSFKLNSIESRKGGVGKTTIALNLAHAFMSKGPVLLLDCDITGTSISEPASNSPFWHEYTNVIVGPNGSPLNLLGYFLKSYIRGNERLDEVLSADKWNARKINVIGSDLYDSALSLIVDTRKLMDDLHSYWLLKYIQHIIQCFERAFEGRTVHIIVDNSPGYVGFCETLHSFMFDCGPNIAKFLFVTSADAQDLIATISAADEIKNKVNDRLLVAKYYKSLDEGKEVDKEIDKRIKDDSALKRFLIDIINDNSKVVPYTDDSIPVSKYLSIVLNKVPQSLDDDGLSYDFAALLGEQKMSLFLDVVSPDKNFNPRNKVYFDEVISFQYYLKYLKNASDAPSVYWNRRLRSLLVQCRDLATSEVRPKAIQTLAKLYQNLIKSLQTRGYKRLAKDMPEQWAPTYALDDLQDYLQSLPSTEIEYVNQHPLEETVRRLHEWNEHKLTNLSSIQAIRPHIDSLKAVLAIIEQWLDSSLNPDNVSVLTMISAFLKVFEMKCHHEMGVGETFTAFLIRSSSLSVTQSSWKPYVTRPLYLYNELIWSQEAMQTAFERYFNEFYRFFCAALLRTIEAFNDFEVVLTAISLYVQRKSVLPFSAEMKDYLNEIIVYRTEQYNSEKLESVYANSLSMVKIKDMLSRYVIKKWEK